MKSVNIQFGLACAYLRTGHVRLRLLIHFRDSTLHGNHVALNSLLNGGEM